MGDNCCETGCCGQYDDVNNEEIEMEECVDYDCCGDEDYFDDGCDFCDYDEIYDEGEEIAMPLQVGLPAPYFEMEGYYKGEKDYYFLDDFEGKWVVLFFYPLDFTFVCPTELLELNKKIKKFEELGAQVLGVSVDSVYSHQAWSKELGDLNFPLLSDITKEASLDYNVLIPEQGISLRGAFIISPEGILESMTVNNLDTGRNIDEILRTIEALQTGDLCPANWKKGDKTLGEA